jgi:hypothetical protein
MRVDYRKAFPAGFRAMAALVRPSKPGLRS